MNAARLVPLAAAGLLAAAVPLVHAAPPGSSSGQPQLVAICGDHPQETLRPGDAIKSFQLSTTGVTTTKLRKIGHKSKRVTTYTPKNLVGVLTTCGAVDTSGLANFTVDVNMTGCNSGSLKFQYKPGSSYAAALVSPGDVFVNGCGSTAGQTSELLADVHASPAGSKVTWVIPLDDFGGEVPIGTTFSNFNARADVDDPYSGEIGTYLVGGSTGGRAGDLDYAHSDATWKLG